MKFLKTNIYLIIILSIISCKEKNSEVTISGNIKGDSPYIINYTSPTNKASYPLFKEPITPDSIGNFQIKLPIKEAAFIKIIINKEDNLQQITNTSLVIEPNKNYVINFNLKKKKKFKIEGYNKTAQIEINNFNNPAHIQIAARPFFKDSLISNIIHEIDSLKNKDLLKLKTLYKKDSISKDFFDLVKLDREYYYTSLKGTIGFVKFLMSERNKDIFNNKVRDMWASCFNNDLLTRSDFQNTEWGYAFLENYLFYKDYETVNFNKKQHEDLFKKTPRIEHSINTANKFLPKDKLEFYKASFLCNNLMQKNYEEELITVFNNFNTDFPNSNYKKHFKSRIDDVVAYHEKVKEPFDKKINFIEDYTSINKLDEVLQNLKGKKVYIDIWATWCGPCKKEFKHNKDLKDLLKKYNYEILYISLDRKQMHQQWLDMIKFYDLKGNHLRATKELSKDLHDMGIKYIPWYILINDGEIVKKRAQNPSKIKDLEKQLLELEG